MNALRGRVREHIEKKASDASSAADPTEKGEVVAKEDPAESKEKSNLPKDEANQSLENTKLEDKPLKPSSTGKNMEVKPKDGNAEDANISKRANGLRGRIQNLLVSKSASKSEDGAEDPKVEKKADEDNKQTKEAAKTKEPGSEIEMNSETLMKLASAIFDTEEGVEQVLPLLRKKAGHEAGLELLRDSAEAYRQEADRLQRAEVESYEQELAKQAFAQTVDYLAGQHQAVTKAAASKELVKNASVLELEKRANETISAHLENIKDLNPLEKQAYMQGAGPDAEAMAGGEELPGAGEEGPTIEQIAELIALAVETGDLAPEQGEALIQELLASEGGVPEEGMEEAPMEEEIPEEALMAEEAGPAKEASVNSTAANFLAKVKTK